MRKYYKKYFVLYIIGIISLIAVDVAQLFIPEFLGDIVNILTDKPADAASQISRIIIWIIAIAIIMFAGRMLWRFALFNASIFPNFIALS